MSEARKTFGIVLALMLLFPGAAVADEERAPTLEPEGVAAGQPYQVKGILEWVDAADKYLIVNGVEYHYQSLRIHGSGAAASTETLENEVRLQPGMKIGLATGGRTTLPILEVWVLK